MGCWNETCAISNLPIKLNDKVVWILLKKADDLESSHGVYPTDYWTPICLPFFGKYDEYGGITLNESIEKPILEFLNAILENNIVFTGQCGAEWNVIDEKKKFEEIQKELIEGKSGLKIIEHKKGKEVSLRSILILREVWNEFLKLKEGLFYNKNKREERQKVALETLKLLKIIGSSEAISATLDIDTTMSGLCTISGESNRPKGPMQIAMGLFVEGKITEKQLKFLLSRISQLLHINLIFNKSRRMWAPTTGSGSQSSNMNLANEIFDIFKEYIDNNITDLDD